MERRTRQNATIIVSSIELALATSSVSELPTLKVQIKTNEHEFVDMNVIPDTGAQVAVGGRDHMKELKVSENDLERSSIYLRNANNNSKQYKHI